MIRALVVEDDRTTRLLLQRLLEQRNIEVTPCVGAEAALTCFAQRPYPLIVLDLTMPGIGGLEFCRRVRAMTAGDVPYILVATGNNRPDELEDILAAGADDYMTKPYPPAMFNIRLTVAENHIAQKAKRRSLEADLTFLALHDPLTRLLNRSQLSPMIEKALLDAKQGHPSALLYIDLDNFKVINDTLGHPAGDRVLVTVASILRSESRTGDGLIRFGGDEFVIVLPQTTTDDARELSERLRKRLDNLHIHEKTGSFRLSASIGLAPIVESMTPEELVGAVDSACYVAKARGRNRVELYRTADDEFAKLLADTNWARLIRDAMETEGLALWFQPVVRLNENRSVLYNEALVRYINPADGAVVNPGAFLAAVERSGQAIMLDRYVLQKAFQALFANAGMVVGVNLSGQSFNDPSFPEFVEWQTQLTGIDPGQVVFEITETLVIANLVQARQTIQHLQSQGFRFALDDFGAGFASLMYLKQLAVDVVKIEGSFVRNLNNEPVNKALIRAIQDVAHILRLETVAESVENAETLATLVELGISAAQGYYLGAPSPIPVRDSK
jgi:diguanylate cyclase (GGDEF)-like protein